jgi:hypothetical protein
MLGSSQHFPIAPSPATTAMRVLTQMKSALAIMADPATVCM